MMSEAAVPTDTPEIKRAQRAQVWWVRTALIGSILTTVLVIALVGFHFTDSAKQSTTRTAAIAAAQAARRAVATNARSDCRSEYNAYRNSVIENRNTVAITAQQDVIGYLLGLSSTEQLASNRAALSAANAAVAALPSLPDMTDNGYKDASGNVHPPCPKVS